jgi:hypothetical protein
MKTISSPKSFLWLLATTLAVSLPAHSQRQGKWQADVVEKNSAAGAEFSSLAIDRFGNFHVAYSTHKELRYAFRKKENKNWQTAIVDATGGTFESLAVDSLGWAHIVYNSSRVPGLHYAAWDGKQWQKFLIDVARTGHQTSIQLDSQDHVRISYFREQFSDHHSARDLKYAYFDGKQWYIQTVDHRSGTGRWNSIGIDRAGNPYISYSTTAPGNMSFAYLEEATWQHSLADLPTNGTKRYLDCATSLAIDSKNSPHIVYIDAIGRTLNYSWRQDSVWHQETIDSLVATGADSDQVSLKMDRAGRPHVAYYDSGLGILKYATRDENGWHTESVEADDAGEYASLALDENDQPYISFSAPVERELRVAHLAGSGE